MSWAHNIFTQLLFLMAQYFLHTYLLVHSLLYYAVRVISEKYFNFTIYKYEYYLSNRYIVYSTTYLYSANILSTLFFMWEVCTSNILSLPV